MENKKVHMATKLEIFKYSFGGIGSNISFSLLTSYLMFFYTDVFGISALSVGALFLIARLIDAVTDPLMGMIADRTRTRFGRYRPWIIFVAPILGISVMLLFFTPDLDYNQKVIYAYATYILYSLVSTMVNIPYHAIKPGLSEDSNQRTQIASIGTIFGIPPTLFVATATIPLVAIFGGGEKGWFLLACLVALISVLSFWTCASGAKRHDVIDPEQDKIAQSLSVRTQLTAITKNKPLLLLMAAFGVQMLASSMNTAVNMYYMTYSVGRVDLIPIIGLLTVLIAIPVAVFMPSLSRRFDKKQIFIYGNVISTICALCLYITPTNNIPLVVIVMVLIQATGQVGSIIGWAMLPDCVSYAKWKLNLRADGTISSSLTFMNKCGMAFGGLIAGVIMSAVGYVAGAEQTPIVLQSIVLMKSVVPAIAHIIAIFLIMQYPITNKSFKVMLQEIQERSDATQSNS